MIRGLYTAAAGLSIEARRNEIIANNLANVNTNGYKRDDLVAESFRGMLLYRMNDPAARAGATDPQLVGSLGTGSYGVFSAMDNAQGGLTQTGNPLDLAMAGEGFFAVETRQGERYTRDGSFARSTDGFLVTADGFRVLGQNGPVRLGTGEVTIETDGTVRQDGRSVDRLRIVRFQGGETPTKEGSNLLRVSGQVAEVPRAQAQVRQGFVERSNVNVVREMVSMIAALRSYETNQKVIQVHDELLAKAVNEVGRV